MAEQRSSVWDEEAAEPESEHRTARIVALLALGAAVVLVIYLLFFSSNPYTVTAEFENASQLVRGNVVTVAGDKVGTVQSIELGPHGQALVKFTVDDQYAPLKEGTTATVRSGSLSSIAGRQVALTLPPQNSKAPEIADGGEIPLADTTSEVDLDQVFDTLNPKTIANFKHVIQGFEISYSGSAPQANKGFHYANPFLSTSRRVFSELTLDQPALEHLIVDSSALTGALAQKAPDISLLVHNLNGMMGALASQRDALARSIALLPGFMRHANTTFVNLRAALSDLTPLVNASKPVADRLGPFFHTLRGAARDAVPTISGLSQIIRRPGAQNDLLALTRDAVPLKRAGIGSGAPNCGKNPATDYAAAADNNFTQGALGESNCSLRNSLPTLSFFRPYTPELVGWFNDFGTSGIGDANGGIGRIGTTLNIFSPSLTGLPQIALGNVVPFQTLLNNPGLGLQTDNFARCPGSLERNPGDNSTPFTDGGALSGPNGCNPSEVPLGP